MHYILLLNDTYTTLTYPKEDSDYSIGEYTSILHLVHPEYFYGAIKEVPSEWTKAYITSAGLYYVDIFDTVIGGSPESQIELWGSYKLTVRYTIKDREIQILKDKTKADYKSSTLLSQYWHSSLNYIIEILIGAPPKDTHFNKFTSRHFMDKVAKYNESRSSRFSISKCKTISIISGHNGIDIDIYLKTSDYYLTKIIKEYSPKILNL